MRAALLRVVFVPLMCTLAECVLDHFRDKLKILFPEARILKSVYDWDPLRDVFALLIAPVKGKERIRVKVEEYVSIACSVRSSL